MDKGSDKQSDLSETAQEVAKSPPIKNAMKLVPNNKEMNGDGLDKGGEKKLNKNANKAEIPDYTEFNGYKVKYRKMFIDENDPDAGRILNGVDLKIDNSFGCLSLNIEKNGMFISENENNIIFPSGDHLAKCDILSKKTDFVIRQKNKMGEIQVITSGISKKREVLIGVGDKIITEDNVLLNVSIFCCERQKWIYCEHSGIPGLNEDSKIKQVIIPDFSRYCVTLVDTPGQAPFVTFFKHERQNIHRKGEIDPKVKKIAVNPFSHHIFVAIGNEYVRNYTAGEKAVKELKETIIPQKYEKDNDFTDIKFFPDSHSFVLVSAQRNIFIIEGKSVVFIRYEQSPNLAAELTTQVDILEIDSEKANKEVEAEMEMQRSLFNEYKDKPMDLIVETHKKGFVVANQTNFGFFNIYTKNKDNEVSLIQSFCLSLKCLGINSISISFDRSYLVLSAKVLDQNIEDQLAEMKIVDEENKVKRCRTELYQFCLSDAYSLKDPNFKPIFKNGNPLGAILDISVSVSKNLVSSVGADKYLRIFEYSVENNKISSPIIPIDTLDTNYRQLCCYYSKEVLHSVSMHPMGFQVAVGTREGVKIFYLIEDGIKLAVEIHGKVCKFLRYSNGGHFLAAGNGNNITIIDPYTFQSQFTLVGHPSSVRYLKWTESDSHLLSNCHHGTSYGWCSDFEMYKNRGMKNERGEPELLEFNIKHTTLNSYVYDEEYDLACYCTSDCKMNIMSTKFGCKSYLTVENEEEITSLCLAKNLQVLFTGTAFGSIKVFLWPIMLENGEDGELPECAEFHIHASRITSLEISHDHKFLISSSEDGSIFFNKIYQYTNGVDFESNIANIQDAHPLQKRQYYQAQKCKVHLHMNNLSLVFKSALEQKSHQIQELKYKAENLKAYYQEERNAVANKYAEEINSLNAEEVNNFEKEKIEAKHMEEREALIAQIAEAQKNHKDQTNQLNLDYDNKLKIAYEQRDKLVEEYERITIEYKRRLDVIQQENQKALKHIEKEYKEKYEELQKNHIRLINDKKRDGEKFNIALDQCEEDYEKEIQKKKREFDEFMKMLTEETDELKDTRDENKREADKLEKRIRECEINRKKYEQEQNNLKETKNIQEEELNNAKDQLKDKQSVIKNKEKVIKELKNYSEHLENFKFVLNSKINSLKNEKAPMEEQVKILEGHIRSIYNELAEETTKNKNLGIKLEESKKQYEKMRKETLRAKVDLVTFTKRKIQMMQYDLQNALKSMNPKEISEVVQKYNKHFNVSGIGTNLTKGVISRNRDDSEDSDEDIVKEELVRQRNWLDSQLKNMSKSNKKLENERKKIQNDNLELIYECNSLRKQNGEISKKVLVLEKKFKDLCGISVNNSEMIDSQIENFLKKASTISTKHKETPFVTMKKEKNSHNRSNLLSTYYAQYSKPGKMGSKNYSTEISNKKMKHYKSGRRNLNSIFGDLKHNQDALQSQNLELRILRDQVSTFMNEATGRENKRSSSQPPLPDLPILRSDSKNLL
ncbi:unnamed protein product [Moneuplotes crassus]|uniref:WD repeat-containing protein 65 n=2 Tax=Euplotes crassus TaxID=5936 RepID=A0AAD1Y7E5_EUPCR|nr:unnamed protein product [Moneuplotes crassus]